MDEIKVMIGKLLKKMSDQLVKLQKKTDYHLEKLAVEKEIL